MQNTLLLTKRRKKREIEPGLKSRHQRRKVRHGNNMHRQMADMKKEIDQLRCTVHQRDDKIRAMNAELDRRSPKNVSTLTAESQRNETEAKQLAPLCTSSVSPLFADPLLTERSFKIAMQSFTTIISKKRKKPITANDFVVIVYAPYYVDAFGTCCVPRIDEILEECHLDQVTKKVTCSLKSSKIKKYFLQYATEQHFHEIYERFKDFKRSSCVFQRLWDMGYHQAQDVVQALEKQNVPFCNETDGAWKSIIFGIGGGKCFVSGDRHKGVGDHIRPIRANRHVTGCYGGDSKWNIGPVISALNQPYKNMVLFLPDLKQFYKICLDTATFQNVSFDGFTFEDSQSFEAQYAAKRVELESQRFDCLVHLRNFYKNNAHVQRFKNAILVRNSGHFYRLLQQMFSVDILLLQSLVALPSCSRRAHIPNFVEVLMQQHAIMDLFKVHFQSVQVTSNLLRCLFSSDRQTFSTDDRMNVEKLFPNSVGIKKAYRALWTRLGLMTIVDFVKSSSNTGKLLRWMDTKEKKKLYRKVDALDIYMRLNLWQAYVSSRGNPKMEWKMGVKQFDRIEAILKKGVQAIHDGTQAFIRELTS